MGVLPERQHRGVGRPPLGHAEAQLRREGVTVIQVKALGPSHPSGPYRRTRAVCAAVGFLPPEEFSALWGADNSCLLLGKCLRHAP